MSLESDCSYINYISKIEYKILKNNFLQIFGRAALLYFNNIVHAGFKMWSGGDDNQGFFYVALLLYITTQCKSNLYLYMNGIFG